MDSSLILAFRQDLQGLRELLVFLSRFPDETVKTQSACGGNLFKTFLRFFSVDSAISVVKKPYAII